MRESPLCDVWSCSTRVSGLSESPQGMARATCQRHILCVSERPLRQRTAGEALKHAQWRARSILHRRHRQIKCLLETKLARHGGVRHRIRETRPGRAGRYGERGLRRLRLIIRIRLHAVMDAEHQVIVGSAQSLHNPKAIEQPGRSGGFVRVRIETNHDGACVGAFLLNLLALVSHGATDQRGARGREFA